MTKKGTFLVDVYNCFVTVIVTDKISAEINKVSQANGQGENTTEAFGYFWRLRTDDYYIFYDSRVLDIGVVNHEKSHLIDYILKDREIKTYGEPRAYLDQFVSTQIHRFFKKKGIKV